MFNPEAFDRRLHKCAEFLTNYVTEHNAMPTFDIINAATQIDLKDPGQLEDSHYDWLLQEFETFSRHKALEAAILKGADLLEKGEYGALVSDVGRWCGDYVSMASMVRECPCHRSSHRPCNLVGEVGLTV